MTMRSRLAHRVGRSSQATPAAVDKSFERLTHRNSDNPSDYDVAAYVGRAALLP
jgi:hypothetical protein